MAVATDTRSFGTATAIAIGGTVGLGALIGGQIIGASMNPAHSIAPVLATGTFTELWIVVAVLGTLVGATARQIVRGNPAATG